MRRKPLGPLRVPLGPGAPARDRLVAFGHAYLELLEAHNALLAIAIEGDPLAAGAIGAYRQHLTLLLESETAGLDLEYVTGSMLAALAPGVFRTLRSRPHWPLQRIKAGWTSTVDAWLAVGHGTQPRRA